MRKRQFLKRNHLNYGMTSNNSNSNEVKTCSKCKLQYIDKDFDKLKSACNADCELDRTN